MHDNFDGAELTIYTSDGRDFSLSVDKLELFTMLKAIGFSTDGKTCTAFGEETLLKILSGEINPFRLVSK